MNVESAAGFHCKAPDMSSGCAVDAPPIDIFTAPTPYMMCPACEKTEVVKNKNKNLKRLVFIIRFFMHPFIDAD
ncbi:MAG TPA: hypothetical protein PKD13_09815 [Mariniflexile sp.]|nr:hypothetical protein [Mariniflexile sp.]